MKKNSKSTNRSENLSVKSKVESSEILDQRWYTLFLLAIIVLCVLLYSRVFQAGFVYDDYNYVVDNKWNGRIDVIGIFSSFMEGNYHPLTVMMLSIQHTFFGLNSLGYHAVNLGIHLVNIVLVSRLILFLCHKWEVAILTAFLFAIHPIHVESVAWISELKDVLYTCFFLLAFIFYLKFADGKNKKWYFLSLMFFIAALLSKAMAVSLPVLMLLTDFFLNRKMTLADLMEKLPFFVLALLFGTLAIVAQKSVGATEVTHYDFLHRMMFASYVYVSYIVNMILPHGLCAYYPYPEASNIPSWFYVCVPLVLLFIAVIFYSLRFTKLYFFGVGVFTVSIFIVLQLFPVGDAIMADRYSYFPSIGIFYIASERWMNMNKGSMRNSSYVLLGFFAIYFSYQTYVRTDVWKNDMTLWASVIEEQPNLAIGYNNRGGAFMKEKRYNEALNDFLKSVALKPYFFMPYFNIGVVYVELNKPDQAIINFTKAIQIKPDFVKAYHNRGLANSTLKNYEAASNDFSKALQLDPNHLESAYNKGNALMNLQRYDESLVQYNLAIKQDPQYINAYINKANVLSIQNKHEEALSTYNLALQLSPRNALAFFSRGNYFMSKKNDTAALADFAKAIDIDPGYLDVYMNRGNLLYTLKQYHKSIDDFSKVLESRKNDPNVFYCRAWAAFEAGKKEQACGDLSTAGKLGMQIPEPVFMKFCR